MLPIEGWFYASFPLKGCQRLDKERTDEVMKKLCNSLFLSWGSHSKHPDTMQKKRQSSNCYTME
jgi:hypothetical protein